MGQPLLEFGMNEEEDVEVPGDAAQAKTRNELLAMMANEDLEDFRRRAALNHQVNVEAGAYLGKPPSEWPQLIFNWDLDPKSARFALDGFSIEQFSAMYSNGLRLGWVTIGDLDKVLCTGSQVSVAKQWNTRSASKLAKAVAYVAGGHPVTPPLVHLTPDRKQLVFAGGNHRYAVALAIQESQIPVYMPAHEVNGIQGIVTIQLV